MSALQCKQDLWRWRFDSRVWVKVKCKQTVPELAHHSAVVVKNFMVVYGGDKCDQNSALQLFDFGDYITFSQFYFYMP